MRERAMSDSLRLWGRFRIVVAACLALIAVVGAAIHVAANEALVENMALSEARRHFRSLLLNQHRASREDGVAYRLTALHVRNPENAPDDWERRALVGFQGNVLKEVWGFVPTLAERKFRYMAPLPVEASCVDCHVREGYRVGDRVGGISVSVDTSVLSAAASRNSYVGAAAILGGAAILILLIGAIAARYGRRLEFAGVRFEEIARNVGDWLWEIDTSGRYHYVAGNFREISGYEIDQLLGRHYRDFMSAEEADRFGDLLSATMQTGQSQRDHELRLVTRDGLERFLIASMSPYRDADGKTLGVRGAYRDITPIREAMLSTERERRRFEDLVQSVDGIVWEADAHSFDFSFVSRQAERLLGFPVEDWYRPGFWFEHLHPDDRERAVKYCVACTQAAMDHDFEYRFIARDGRTVWLRDFVSVVSKDGVPSLLRGLMIDISDIKRTAEIAAATLREKEAILDNALVGIVLLKHRVIMSCNRRFEELFGYGSGEMLGQTTSILYATRETFDQLGVSAYDAVGRGENFSGEILLHRRDGSEFWGALTGRAIDPERPHDGSIWIYTDVSERRRAEEEVHKLLRAVEQSMVSVVITNRDGGIEYVNPRFCAVTGYSRGEVIGRNPRLLQSGETPPDIYAELWQTILAGHEWRGLLHNRRRNGELFWEDASISPIVDDAGNITHFLAVKEDITRRKEAEDALKVSAERLKMALEGANDGLWDLDLRSGSFYFSPRCATMLGLEPGGLAATLDAWGLLIHPDDLERTRGQLTEHLAGRLPAYEAEYRLRNHAGDWVWILARGKVVERDADGRALRVVGTHTDVSERKRIEQELLRHRDDLESLVVERTRELQSALTTAKSAERAKDEFLANMSHEIRTPLNAIVGLSGLAMKTRLDAKQRDYLQKILHAGESLMEVINDVLDLSKIAAGRMNIESLRFAPCEMYERVMSVMAHKAAEKGLDLSGRLADDVPEFIVGDPARVNQILLNLVGNAIKFTAQGHVRIDVSVEAREAGRVRLRIEVADSGIGMSQEDISKIFKAFTQADTSTTRRFGGTGLGLVISRRLAEMMRGSIDVSSEPGIGSCFVLHLWFDLLPATDATGEMCRIPPRPATTWRFDDVRLLLVEDQPVNRQIATELLTEQGATVEIAENGAQALEKLGSVDPGTYDAVLMDVQMPVMDGLTATRLIRRRPELAALPIIAMTAHVLADERQRGLDAGMNDHVGKPFSPTDLFRVIARHVSKASLVEQSPGFAEPAVVVEPLAGFDVAGALERFGGKRQKFDRWLTHFSQERHGASQELHSLLDTGAVEDAKRLVHAIKGQAGTLGIVALHRAAADLEQVLKNRAPWGEALAAFSASLTTALATIARDVGAGADIAAGQHATAMDASGGVG